MSNRSDPIFIGIAIVAIGATFAAWNFSEALNLNFKTGSRVLIGVFIISAISIYSMLNQWFSAIAIFVLPILWFSCLPAIDYWAANSYTTNFGFSRYSEFPWWAEWYTKAGVFFGLLGFGYLIKKLRSPYY